MMWQWAVGFLIFDLEFRFGTTGEHCFTRMTLKAERDFYRSLHELRSPPGMKTTGRNNRVRRTIEEEDEKEKDHLQWA
jgi:hypothetical protein